MTDYGCKGYTQREMEALVPNRADHEMEVATIRCALEHKDDPVAERACVDAAYDEFVRRRDELDRESMPPIPKRPKEKPKPTVWAAINGVLARHRGFFVSLAALILFGSLILGATLKEEAFALGGLLGWFLVPFFASR